MLHASLAAMLAATVPLAPGDLLAHAPGSWLPAAERAQRHAWPPTAITVYSDDEAVALGGWDGATARQLPIRNWHAGPGATYVAVYSRQREGAAYSVGGGIWVHGMIRLRGRYDERGIAQVAGLAGKDISSTPKALWIARKAFPQAGACWLGGDTMGFSGALDVR